MVFTAGGPVVTAMTEDSFTSPEMGNRVLIPRFLEEAVRPRDMRLLEIYLDDHWAGAGAGERLARRLAKQNSDTEWADRLDQLADQIAEDDQTLAHIRSAFGIDGGKLKRAMAIGIERAGRLKLNGRFISYSPLSRLLECEALEAGVSAKRKLWTALRVAMAETPELNSFDLDRLVERADEQLDVLRSFHRFAAAMALSPTGTKAT